MKYYRIVIGILFTSIFIFSSSVFCQTCNASYKEDFTKFEKQLRSKRYINRYTSRRKTPSRYFLYRDPAIAAGLSATVPGLGQLFANRPDKGVAFFIAELTIFSIASWSYGRADYYDDYSDRYDWFYDKHTDSFVSYDEGYGKARGYAAFGTVFLLSGVGVYIWNIFDAFETADQYNKQIRQFAWEIKFDNSETCMTLSRRF